MNGKLLRVISFILAISVTFSVAVYAGDAIPTGEDVTTTQYSENETPADPDTPTEPDVPDEPDEPDVPDVPDEPDEPEKPTYDEIPGDTVVGRMYICAQLVLLGHAWIYIDNTFDGEIPVGCITAEAGEGVSVGTFLMTRSDGGGIYYNVEQYCAEHYGLRSEAWVGMDITKNQLEKVNDKIINFNYWGLYLNCTFFASQVWNSVSDKFIMPMMFPIFTKAQIKTHGGNSDVVMKQVEPDECYKQRGSGNNARAEVVSEGTLDSALL